MFSVEGAGSKLTITKNLEIPRNNFFNGEFNAMISAESIKNFPGQTKLHLNFLDSYKPITKIKHLPTNMQIK